MQATNASENIPAWLEQRSGGNVPLLGTCSIGRLSSNTIILPDERVSRRHALINVQGRQEFWLVDLGSGNGTYLNGRRVVQPTRLRDGDQIEIAAFQLRFHQASSSEPSRVSALEERDEGKTLQQIQATECWLLVADIEDSTQLMQKVSESALPLVTGRWLNDCKRTVENHGGNLNKFLGDGFFAYWRHAPNTEEQVAQTLEALGRMRDSLDLMFRVVLHFGQVFMGGGASLGEESLQGKEVHFVFRMEKLAAMIGERCLISDAARSRLPVRLALRDAGKHAVAGFDGEHPFHSLAQ